MKKVIYAIMLALLVSCSPEEIKPKDNNTSENPGENPGDNPGDDKPSEFRVTDTSGKELDLLLFGREATDRPLYVRTDLKLDEWSVSCDAPWCQVSKDYGLIRVTVGQHGEMNEYLYPRSCTMLIKAKGYPDKSVTIAQESDTRIGTYNYRNSFRLSPSGAPLDIFINSNYWEWKVLNKNSWFTTEQPNKYTLRVRAVPKDESDNSVRSGKITLYSAAWDEDELESLWWNKVYYLYFSDSDADISGEDYQYGDNQNWD